MAKERRMRPCRPIERTAVEAFADLERAIKAMDMETIKERLADLGDWGWFVDHAVLEGLERAATFRGPSLHDTRPMVRVWGFAPLAGLTIQDFCEMVVRYEVPPPAHYDYLGPAWDRAVVDYWIEERGLDR